MDKWKFAVAFGGVLAITGAAVAQDEEVEQPRWDVSAFNSGNPSPMSLDVGDLPAYGGSGSVDIPFTIDQPAAVHVAVYSTGANPAPIPFIRDQRNYGAEGRWDGVNQVYVGTVGGIARGENTFMDTMLWRTPDENLNFDAGSHSITWPGTDLAGNQMPAGDYTFYILTFNDQNVTTVGRAAAMWGVEWEIDFDAEPPEIWGWATFNDGSDAAVNSHFTKSTIGTDWRASPDAYESYSAGAVFLASATANGNPEGAITQWGFALDPRAKGRDFYLTDFTGPATGIHKVRLNDDGVVEAVSEFGENGYVFQPARTYQIEYVFDQLVNINANRTDLVDEVIYSDPDTGERLRALDFTEIFGGEILSDGEPVPFVGGMSSFAVNENGVWATSHSSRSVQVLRADHTGKEIWVNANGDNWIDTIVWDHDNDPETGMEWVVADHCKDSAVGAFDMYFCSPGTRDSGEGKVGVVLGPDGKGFARLKIREGTSIQTENSNELQYHDYGGPYDGWYKSIGYDPTKRADQIEALELPYEPGPGWVVHIPGRIRRGSIGEKGTAVLAVSDETPDSYSLDDAYPNPFNPETTIQFKLPQAGYSVLSVYNTAGQEVARLADERLEAGVYQTNWGGRDKSGQLVSSGVYLYTLKVGSFVETKRMTLLK
jgi:hypothetical protein